jgi:hypothetical protein
MTKRQSPNWLCKLRLHKWRNYGESVVITWKEPGVIFPKSYTTQSREVLTKRECLRCGLRVKRRLVNNPDGTLSCVGWETLSDSEYENDESEESMKIRCKCVRVKRFKFQSDIL